MKRTICYCFGILVFALAALLGCERNKNPVTNHLDLFQFRGYYFPIVARTIDGVEVLYAVGLVNFTTNPAVTIEQVQLLVARSYGQILQSWSHPSLTEPAKDELDVMMKIPFSSDPFKVALELNRSSLISSAAPVYIGTPEEP